MNYRVIETDAGKTCTTKDKTYHSMFSKKSGQFIRHGKTYDDDPDHSPAPEILDIEISSGSACSGNCPWCYKDNQPGGNIPLHNLTLADFKAILSKFRSPGGLLLNQIAFGIMDINTNPDFFRIMEHARENGVIPNYTTNGNQVNGDIAARTKELCGAVAVSVTTRNKKTAYDAIKSYHSAGMKQVNIHCMLSAETFEHARSIEKDIIGDDDLRKAVNAIVFLGYKPKGKGSSGHSPATPEMYQSIVRNKSIMVNIGFDSCSAPLVLKAYSDDPKFKDISQSIEPCESGCFSSYINSYGRYFPCSFMEGQGKWQEGLDVPNCRNFNNDIWNHPRNIEWRSELLASSKDCKCDLTKICRSCPQYRITGCKGPLKGSKS